MARGIRLATLLLGLAGGADAKRFAAAVPAAPRAAATRTGRSAAGARSGRGARRLFASSGLLLALAAAPGGAQDQAGGVLEDLGLDETGRISKAAFVAASIETFADAPWAEDQASKMEAWWASIFDKADLDGDGMLEYPGEVEYLTYLTTRALLAATSKMARLTPAELEEDLDVLQALSVGEEMSQVFQELDVNGDSRIDRGELLSSAHNFVNSDSDEELPAEIIEFLDSAFTRADLDGDGTLDESEVEYLGFLLDEVLLRMETEDLFEQDDAEVRSSLVSALYRVVDENEDGHIDKEELRRAIRADMEDEVEVGAAGEVLPLGDYGTQILRTMEKYFDDADADGDERLSPEECGRLLDAAYPHAKAEE